MIKVASMTRFKKILVADCATRLSIRILTDIAGGRGDQVASDTVSIVLIHIILLLGLFSVLIM